MAAGLASDGAAMPLNEAEAKPLRFEAVAQPASMPETDNVNGNKGALAKTLSNSRRLGWISAPFGEGVCVCWVAGFMGVFPF